MAGPRRSDEGRWRGEAMACGKRSRGLLQDGGEAQIIGVVAVGALRSGVAEPFGQAALAEQPGRLLEEVIEIMKNQYLFSDREQLGNGGAELGEHRGAAACRLEQACVDSAHLG